MKILVIGLDGATWTLLRPLTQDGKMPCLKRMMAKASSGVMLSTFPAVSAAAWTSITTGKNPGKHGVFDFVKVGKRFRQSLCSSKSKMTNEVWDYLDGSIVANVPLTYPPKRVSGMMISGMDTPSVKSEFTYPRSLRNDILSRIPGYSIELDWQDYEGKEDEFYQDIQEVTEQKIDLFWYLFSLKWNLLFFVLTETDRIQHLLWGSERLTEYYVRIDRFLMNVMKEVSKKDIVLVLLSDHGFQSVEKTLYVNTVLRKLGQAGTKDLRFGRWLEAGGITKERLWELLRQVGLIQAYNNLSPDILHVLRTLVPGKSNIEYDFDLEKTEAVMIGYGGIYLSKEDSSNPRDTGTNVLIDRIARTLEEERDPETGARVVERVYRNSELYHGPFASRGPDLVVAPSENYTLSPTIENKAIGPLYFRKGGHSPEGILLIYGQDVKKGFKIPDASVYDVAPTILHIAGVPVPADMDGRVLTEVFEDGSKLDRPVSYRRQTEEQKVKQKLKEMKALGRI